MAFDLYFQVDKKTYKILHFTAKYSKETYCLEAEYLYSTMRDKIPDFPSNLLLINAENHVNSDTLKHRKESWYQFSFCFVLFLVQEQFFISSNRRKATVYFKCMCIFFLRHKFLWSVFLYLKIFNEDEDSKTVPKLKFCCQFCCCYYSTVHLKHFFNLWKCIHCIFHR